MYRPQVVKLHYHAGIGDMTECGESDNCNFSLERLRKLTAAREERRAGGEIKRPVIIKHYDEESTSSSSSTIQRQTSV
uniref:Uncharacterized protein n=1 Tax=Bursaphelenchus xylophilus TaxID=6326 RepID=A0A1I7RWE7_BURXY